MPSSFSPLLDFIHCSLPSLHPSLSITFVFFVLCTLFPVPSLSPLALQLVLLILLASDSAYLPLNISPILLQFLRLYHILSVPLFRSPDCFDHRLFFLFFSTPLITPEMIFFYAPLYLPPSRRAFPHFLSRFFAFVMTGITVIFGFLLLLVSSLYLLDNLSLAFLSRSLFERVARSRNSSDKIPG